jgi:hypothetical protein
MICHQLPSPDFPVIWALVPTLKPLSTTQPVLGPRRQLTATSLGKATGTVGVDVAAGGGVLEGGSVNVGATVTGACVEEGVKAVTVGVSVGRLDGRLQASIARTRTNVGNKLRDFIPSLLCVVPIILCRNLPDGNSARVFIKKPLVWKHQGFLKSIQILFT